MAPCLGRGDAHAVGKHDGHVLHGDGHCYSHCFCSNPDQVVSHVPIPVGCVDGLLLLHHLCKTHQAPKGFSNSVFPWWVLLCHCLLYRHCHSLCFSLPNSHIGSLPCLLVHSCLQFINWVIQIASSNIKS